MSLRNVLIILGLLGTTIGLMNWVPKDDAVIEDPSLVPDVAQWFDIAADLEDSASARALLGGIHDDDLDARIERGGFSWAGYQKRARELIARVNLGDVTQRSCTILGEGIERVDFGAAGDSIEALATEDDGEGDDLDPETAALVRRLLIRLPGEG